MAEVADRRTAAEYTRGAVYGLAAVSIWSGGIVVAGLGLRTSLTPWDIAAIRFGVAGLLLIPLLLRKGLAFDRLGWIGLAAIMLGAGAPVLLANAGLLFAPAAHAGALFPGVMPLMVAILAAVILPSPVARSLGSRRMRSAAPAFPLRARRTTASPTESCQAESSQSARTDGGVIGRLLGGRLA